MCLIHSNRVADDGFRQMSDKDQVASETRLAQMADEDSIEYCNGLGNLIKTVDDWAKIDALKHVKKYRVGRHRFYIAGHHTQCNYDIGFILVNKRDADDKPGDKKFQNRIQSAFESARTRTLPPPLKEVAEDEAEELPDEDESPV